MSKIKAVIFDVGGVILPQPQKSIIAYGKALGLPSRFLPDLFLHGVPNNAFCQLERGELTLAEFFPYFEKEANKKAKADGILLPEVFSAKNLFSLMTRNKEDSHNGPSVNPDMMRAATILRRNKILTCVLTNNWIDEDKKFPQTHFKRILKSFFNVVVESAYVGQRKPEKKIYEHTCKRLGVNPQDCVFLDDIGVNLKAASQLGIKGIKVQDPKEALKELEVLTNVKLLVDDSTLIFPPPCSSADVVHAIAEVSPGIKIHFVEAGDGPAVLLLHGFPDFWYGWRYQIPALANAGYRAIALDQRGYGDSSSPPNVDDFSQVFLAGDAVAVLDKLGISVATVVGHDWGGALAWSLALKYPDRFLGVCSVNTPFYKINPDRNPLVGMQNNPGVFDYQLYFQTVGVAEKELDHDTKRSLSLFYQGYKSKLKGKAASGATSQVRKRGGMLVGFPKDIPLGDFMSTLDMEAYTEAFKKTGFRGGLNWYRNYENNWKWLRPISHRKITMPALMVTASHDMVLKPEYSYGMEKYVLNLKRLHIEKCSHWTMQERPNELNDGLLKWLDNIHSGRPNLQAKLFSSL